MKNHKRKIGNNYSEKEMADLFRKQLLSRKGLPGLPKFRFLFSEVDCKQGRPDFVALSGYSKRGLPSSKPVGGYVAARVLSLLKPKAPRTLKFLRENSDASEKAFRKTLKELVGARYISETSTGSFLLGPKWSHNSKLWAFEIKLNNPKRAIFQAKQYRAFADRVFIVAPPLQIRNYEKHMHAMKRWDIGLMSFDPNTTKSEIHRRSPQKPPLSREHRAYAVAKLLQSKAVSR